MTPSGWCFNRMEYGHIASKCPTKIVSLDLPRDYYEGGSFSTMGRILWEEANHRPHLTPILPACHMKGRGRSLQGMSDLLEDNQEKTLPELHWVPLSVVKQPFQRIAMHMISPLPATEEGHRFVLTVCDFGTGCLLLKITISKDVVEALILHVCKSSDPKGDPYRPWH